MVTDIIRKSILKKPDGSGTVHVPELLSPAGDPECGRAAVMCGADAIYLGLKEGSARAAAGNFTFPQLREMCSFAHSSGVLVYVAVNTLPFGDAETSSFALNAEKAASEGADGVIVQDTGLITLLSEMRNTGRLPPFFRIHASTQAGLANAGGMRIAEALGADRVILPRELTLEEIKTLKAGTDLELETFVHGAMCMGYSGSCLLSSYIGGRSGNRGSCAQPCRMKYRIDESENAPAGGMRELLSPDDLCALPFLDEVCRSGVSSLKIEGRLKSPEYTALTTRIYREALDAVAEGRFDRFVKEELDDALRCLRTMFTRSGGGPGFLLGNTGRSHMTGRSAGKSGALLGNAVNVRPLRAPAGVQDGLSFFSFVLTAPKNAPGSRPQAILSPGDGVTLIDDLTGEAFGGTVNRADANTGEITVCAGMTAGNAFRSLSASVFQTSDASLLKTIRELLSSGRRNVKLPVRLSFSAAPGERAVLSARLADEGPAVTVQSDGPVKEALTSPLSGEEISARLSKLNDTGFYAFSVDTDVRGNIFMPVSALNSLRRRAAESLAGAIAAEGSARSRIMRPESSKPDKRVLFAEPSGNIKQRAGYLLEKSSEGINSRYYYDAADLVSESDSALSGCGLVYLPWKTWLDDSLYTACVNKARASGCLVAASLPQLPFGRNGGQFIDALNVIRSECDAIQLVNTGDFGIDAIDGIIRASAGDGMLICADLSLNCTGPLTFGTLAKLGADVITLSPEYPDAKLALKALPGRFAEIVSGPLTVMRMRHCVIGHGEDNCRRCGNGGAVFKMYDTAGLKYDILTLPDGRGSGRRMHAETVYGDRFCENLIISSKEFEPKASFTEKGTYLRRAAVPGSKRVIYEAADTSDSLTAVPANLIFRTNVAPGNAARR